MDNSELMGICCGVMKTTQMIESTRFGQDVCLKAKYTYILHFHLAFFFNSKQNSVKPWRGQTTARGPCAAR